MAKLIDKLYDRSTDYDNPQLWIVIMEENGVIYKYNQKDEQCYVSNIEEGIENVVIADEIYVDGIGKCPVVRWGISHVYKKSLEQVKSIKLGGNLKEYDLVTFWDLDKLEKIVIPESLVKFPPFKRCNNLKEIVMPDKFSVDLEEFAWTHPKLQKVILLHNGNRKEILSSELDAKRDSFRVKLEKEEKDRIAEEKRKEQEKLLQDRKGKFIARYAMIICAIPYLWAITNLFRKMVDYDTTFWNLLYQLFAAVFISGELIVCWYIAVASIVFISERFNLKIAWAIFLPVIIIPLSIIVFYIALKLQAAFYSCSSVYYSITDSGFIQ